MCADPVTPATQRLLVNQRAAALTCNAEHVSTVAERVSGPHRVIIVLVISGFEQLRNQAVRCTDHLGRERRVPDRLGCGMKLPVA